MKKVPTIAITGASGFLGSVLTEYFLRKKWNVVALVRDTENRNNTKNLEYRYYDISKPLAPTALDGVDYVIHTAYIKLDTKHPDALELNVAGAKYLLAAVQSSKVLQSIFISTMSAHEDAISIYGKQKLEIEKLFLEEKNTTVLRCGLIIGDGGIVQEMACFMRSKHAVPLIGGGKQPLQIISVYDVAKVIDSIFEKSLTGRLIAATSEIYSYKSFYAALAKQINTRIVYVPVPYWLLEAIFKAAARLHITLGVGEDNLKGLKKLKSMPSNNDLQKIGVQLMDLDNALKRSHLKG